MPLPTTNIGLNAIHVEVGGTSGTQCSLNESDIRGIGAPDSTYAGSDGISTTSGSQISIGEFRNAVDTVPLSITHYMRNNSSLDSIFLQDHQTSAIVLGHPVHLDVRMYRSDPYVYIQARPFTTAYDIKTWWNTSGTSNTFTSSSTWVNLGRFNQTGATAIKLDWAVSSSGTGGTTVAGNSGFATYAASDNTYQSVSNYQSIGVRMTALSSAECYATNQRNVVVTLNGYMQKSGYQETPLGSYRIELISRATSNNCF